jgi:hypothetical protein
MSDCNLCGVVGRTYQESPDAIKARLLEKYLSNQDLVRQINCFCRKR